jgi:hypothetical protein
VKGVVPLNLAALRVSNPDATNVTSGKGFVGATAAFNRLPYTPGKDASTGDTIYIPLDSGNSALEPLQTGIHLHWELPEYFKRGHQDPATGRIVFPPVPTRWLVVRTLSVWSTDAKSYESPKWASWVVESDYLSTVKPPRGRPAIPVPVLAPDNKTPYMWIGRAVDAATWDPTKENPNDYLPSRKGPDGKPLYLTSIGFLGAGFCGYYPDCSTVFGFYDTFADVPTVYDAIKANEPIRFRASYTVIGWLPRAADDPLSGLAAGVTQEYDTYVGQCAQENVEVARTPTEVFQQYALRTYGWEFSANAIAYTLNQNHTLATLEVPSATLCAGVQQDVVWDELQAGETPFLKPAGGGNTWTADVEIAVGNTTVEAVSALVASQLPKPGGKGVLSSYEILLDALQLGLLRDLEQPGASLVTLEETRHARAFAQNDGGHEWTIQTSAGSGSSASAALTLPLTVAEQLAVLNDAQRAYDQGRAGLATMREQLFMDWVIYVKQFVAKPANPVVPTNELGAFLASSGACELNALIAEGKRVGKVTYEIDKASGRITGVTTTDAPATLAGILVAAFTVVADALAKLKQQWQLDAGPGAPFWTATDPVMVMEGDRLEPARRNGPTYTIAARADTELVAELQLAATGGPWTVPATALPGLPAPPPLMPALAAAKALLGEAALLDPEWAAAIATAAGAPNPATLATAIANAQGGQSPLDVKLSAGLYATVHTAGYKRTPDPQSSVSQPEQLTITFANAAKVALAPDAVGWNAQTVLPELAPGRVDPLLPVWLMWEAQLDPIARSGDGNAYAPDEIEDHFVLDADGVELVYPLPANFTTGVPVSYSASVALSKQPFLSLTEQIDAYLREFAKDPADPELIKARDALKDRRVMSQALGNFNLGQTLRTPIPQITVQDLVVKPDFVTTAIAKAATQTKGDSWYDTAFNSLTAMSTGLEAQQNYGPLRGGFLDVTALATVDVFGQIMSFRTPGGGRPGALKVIPSIDLSPVAGDTVNAGRVYLPPRVLAPTRTFARWLSAAHNDEVPQITTDFVESNDHPATSPVCGWIIPNHLDLALAFYDADGSAIGSFNLEHGQDNVYRTRPGNLENPHSDLDKDLYDAGGKLKVNPHVAAVMTYVDQGSGQFLKALMNTIARSDEFINPARFAQDVSLSILIGRPLAIVRTVCTLDTSGNVLPVSQANTSADDALARAVRERWYDYRLRQRYTSAAIDKLVFPLRLGDLTDIDDGLVAFLPEGDTPQPYTVVYSAAARAGEDPHVLLPGPDAVTLTLGGDPWFATAFVDPRAPVHFTTGILPAETLQIPPDQYALAMAQLAVTFTTRPVLHDTLALRLPVPDEAGLRWAWIAADGHSTPLPPPASADTPIYGYGPQTLLEGWLELSRIPPELRPIRPIRRP